MPKKSFVLCGLACIAGIFGAFIRWIQNMTGFDPQTGLAIEGSPWGAVLVVYLLVIAAVFFFVVRWLKNNKKLTTEGSFPEAFLGGPIVCSVIAFLSFVLIAAGGMLTIYNTVRGVYSMFELISGGFALIAAVCVYAFLTNVNAEDQSSSGAAFLITTVYLCFRLIAEYRANASDPIIWNFAIRILAICAVIMVYYYFSGYCFDKAKPYRTLYFSFLATVLSVTTFSDGVSNIYHLITAGLALAQLLLTLLLIGNMVHATHDPSPE